MTKQYSFRRIDVHYALIQSGFWAMFGSICAYQATLLLSRGFNNSDTGLIISVRCLTGILSQPLLGMFSDRHPNIPLKYITALPMLISFLAGLTLLFYPAGLAGTLIQFAIIGAFELSAYPLIDSMAVQFINAGVPVHYSLGRAIGSVAYAVCCAILGALTAVHGTELVLPVHSVLVLLEILLLLTFPIQHSSGKPAHDRSHPAPQSPLSLLKSHPRFTVTLLSSLFGILGVIALSNFLVNITTAKGGGSAALGAGLFLMGVFELPSAFLFPKLKRRLGVSGLMVLSMAFCTAKCVVFLLAPDLIFLLAAQSLQMLGYGLFTPTSVFLVNENVPAADRVQGQTLMMVASNGLGGVMGSFFAGKALDLGGVSAMLILCTISCLIATVLAVVAMRLPKGSL